MFLSTFQVCMYFIIFTYILSSMNIFSLTVSEIPFSLSVSITVDLVQFSSVAWSCLTFWDPMDCSMPDLPVHHQLPESTQTHVHWVGDAIQPSHPLSSPSPPALNLSQYQFSSVQSLSCVQLFVATWITARQDPLSIVNSRSSLKLASIESVMPSSHLILCCPLLLLPPSPPSIRVFSNESTLHIRWPKYWSFSFSIIPSKEIPGLISFRMDWLDLLSV